MRRIVVGIGILALVLAGLQAAAEIVSLEDALEETAMGRDDAPVTMIEYSSLTCPHCATFHRETLPKIKEAYIDTGKVRLVSRDFPLGGLALAAAVLTRCAGPAKYFGFLEVLFRSQDRWAKAQNPRDALLQVSRFAGLTEADFDACLNNETLIKTIQTRARKASQELGIDSTPTFIIDGRKVPGALSFEEFQDILDAALSKKQ